MYTTDVGLDALINMSISLLSIFLCWRILQHVRIEQVIKAGNFVHTKAMIMLLSVILGHLLSRFFIDYLQWARLLGHLVH